MTTKVTAATLTLTAITLNLIVLGHIPTVSGEGEIGVKRLAKSINCTGQVLSGSHLFRTVSVRSKLECLSHCQRNSTCASFVFEAAGRMCHLGDSNANANCSNMEPGRPGVSFYQEPPPMPPCTRANEVRDFRGVCVCATGFSGNPCTRYMHDCNDIKLYGNWVGDGVYAIKPTMADQPFSVYCRYISSTRTYLLDRRRTSVDYNRPYQEYVNGFGDPNDDYWIGLKNVWALTAERGYEMRVNIKIKDSTNFIQAYSDFRVTNAASGFKLRFNQSINNGVGDCFMDLYDAQFSTYDHDMDESATVNCGLKRKGGLWFRGTACSTCNPFGILYQPNTGIRLGVDDEVSWNNVLGNQALFKISFYLINDPEV